MRFRTTLLLALVFFSLLAYVYFFELGEELSPEELARKILNLEDTEVKSLILEGEEGQIELLKEEAKWVMLTPSGLRLDQDKVQELLTTVTKLEAERVVVSGEGIDYSSYGLTQPKYKLKLELDSGKELVIKVGAETQVGSGYFVQKEGEDKVYRLAKYKADKFLLGANDLRDKRVLAQDLSEVNKIILKQGQQNIELVRSEKGDWQLVQPYRYPASSVSTLISNLENLTGSQFIDQWTDLEEYGLAAPMLSFQLEKEGEEISILIGQVQENGDLFVKTNLEKTIYQVPEYRLYALQKEAEYFVNDDIFAFQDSKEVAEILVKWQGEEWQLSPTAAETEASIDKTEVLLRNLNYTFAAETLGKAAESDLHLDTPYMEIELKMKADSWIERQKAVIYRLLKEESAGEAEDEEEYDYYLVNTLFQAGEQRLDTLLFKINAYDVKILEEELQEIKAEEENEKGE